MSHIARRKTRGGQAVIEVAFMAPWIFLFFAAIFDFGFYAYALINVQNAARIAALATSADVASADSQPTACVNAIQEMRMLPNIAPILATHKCTALPLIVTAEQTVVMDGDDKLKSASRVSVTYQTVQLFPLPFMMGRMTVTRTAEMRVLGD